MESHGNTRTKTGAGKYALVDWQFPCASVAVFVFEITSSHGGHQDGAVQARDRALPHAQFYLDPNGGVETFMDLGNECEINP